MVKYSTIIFASYCILFQFFFKPVQTQTESLDIMPACHKKNTYDNGGGIIKTKAQYETELKYCLLNESNYDRTVVPRYTSAEPLVVEIDIALAHIKDLNMKGKIFTFHGTTRFWWKDLRLTWDPSEYGNITTFTTLCRQIWIPLIVISNQVGAYEDDFDIPYQASLTVGHEGDVYMSKVGLSSTICNCDPTEFPYDKQECELRYISWMLTKDILHLHPRRKKITHGEYQVTPEGGEFKVKWNKSTITQDFSHSKQRDVVKYKFVLERNYMNYVVNIIIPAHLIGVLSLFSYLVPFQSGERIGLVVSCVLALTLLTLVIEEMMPSTRPLPKLMVQFQMYIVFAFCNTLASIIIQNFHHKVKSGKSTWPGPEKKSTITLIMVNRLNRICFSAAAFGMVISNIWIEVWYAKTFKEVQEGNFSDEIEFFNITKDT